MKSNPHPGEPSRADAAFTMVEIALALAVIGFALVAIIGVLPTGLSVQRENREETVINQDANYFMEAIRNGARGLDDLTNYVIAITNVVSKYQFQPDGKVAAGFPVTETFGHTYVNWTRNGVVQPPGYEIINGFRIIGLLSTPKYIYEPDSFPFKPFTSNYVTAYVRSLSGSVTEKHPQDNPGIMERAFTYRLVPEVIPYANWATNWIGFNDPALVAVANNAADPNSLSAQAETNSRGQYWMVGKNLQGNLYDLRLTFRWPVMPNGTLGNGRQIFRTMVSSHQTNQSPYWFFESREYARAL